LRGSAAAAASPAGPAPGEAKAARMRAVTAAYALIITTGIVLYITIGFLHR
jgi:hypothetical protein